MLAFLLNADALLAYYQRQDVATQGALRAFWRAVAGSNKPEARAFREALGKIGHAGK